MSAPRCRHVVLIVFDYMGYGDIEPFGRSEIRTPHTRTLAEQGRRYTDFYAAAPVCGPSRAALMTGRSPRRLGFERNISRGEPGLAATETTVARHLNDAGYRTALYGKWHLGYTHADGPNAHGFDDFLGFHDWNIDYYSHRTVDGRPGLFRNTEPVSCPGYTTDVFTDAAVEFIENGKTEPFFLYVAYNAALPPYDPPGQEHDTARHARWVDGDRADYAASIEHLDAAVGRVVAALERQHLLDDTMLILTYDHGGAELATKGGLSGGFGGLREGGIRVPLIIHWPAGVTAGEVSTMPAILMDLAPTILSAAGIDHPAGLDGVDLFDPATAEIRDRVLRWRIDLLYEDHDWRPGVQRAVRRGHWKYLWDQGVESLHDLEQDPAEHLDVGRDHPDLVAELRELSVSEW